MLPFSDEEAIEDEFVYFTSAPMEDVETLDEAAAAAAKKQLQDEGRKRKPTAAQAAASKVYFYFILFLTMLFRLCKANSAIP